MVWAIFAPKLVYDVAVALVTNALVRGSIDGWMIDMHACIHTHTHTRTYTHTPVIAASFAQRRV